MPMRYTDSQIIDLWLQSQSSPATMDCYRRDAERLLSEVRKSLSRIGLGDLHRFAQSLIAAGLAPVSRGRTLAALVFGASTVVGVGATEELPAVVAPSIPTTTVAVGSAPIVPAHFRPAPDRSQVVSRVLATAKTRVQNDSQPAQAVATLALEIGRLQRDLAVRSPEGMEEWIGGEYASLEAVRRAIADAVVDGEEPAIVAFALNCASQLLAAAA